MLDQDFKIPDFEMTTIAGDAGKVFCSKKSTENQSPSVEDETKEEEEDRDSNPGLAQNRRFLDQKTEDPLDLDEIESVPLVEAQLSVPGSIPGEEVQNQALMDQPVSEPVSVHQPMTVQASPANNDQNDLFDVSQTRWVPYPPQNRNK